MVAVRGGGDLGWALPLDAPDFVLPLYFSRAASVFHDTPLSSRHGSVSFN